MKTKPEGVNLHATLEYVYFIAVTFHSSSKKNVPVYFY